MITAKYFLEDVLDETLTINPNEHISVSYEDLRTARPTINYISMDGLGVDLYDDLSQFATSDDYVGYISQMVSDEQGNSYDRITLFGGSTGEVYDDTFFINHGISLGFVKDYPEVVRLTAYSADGSIALLEDFEVTSLNQHIDIEPFSCERLYIDFIKTKIPNSFIKISYLVLGKIYDFKEFKSFDYIDELNLLSDDLPIGEINFSVFSKENLIGKENNLIVFYDAQKLLGNYYLKECERETINKYNFVVQNEISKANDIVFSNYSTESLGASNEFAWEYPFIYQRPTNYETTTTAGTDLIKGALERAFEAANIKYEIDDYYLNENDWWLSPYLQYKSCRYGIQQICWALCGCVICSDKVYIKPLYKILQQPIKEILNSDNKILKTSVKNSEKISKSIWEFRQYFGNPAPQTAKLSEVVVGDDGILSLSFTSPTKVTEVIKQSTGEKLSFFTMAMNGSIESPYNVKLFVDPNETYVVNGFKLEDSIFTQNIDIQKDGVEKNYNKYDLVWLNSHQEPMINEKTQQILNKCKNNSKLSATIVYNGEKVGDCVSIQDNLNNMFTGIITKLRFKSSATNRTADIEVEQWSF